MRNPWIAVGVWMGVIFWFSHQSGEESLAQSGLILNVLEALGLSKARLSQPEFIFLVRKLAHFIEYSILGFLISRVHLPFLWTAVLILGYAVSDEIHQIFVPGRGFAFMDMGIDFLGGLTGMGLYFVWIHVRRWRI
jgi:VanZ family protein